MSFWFTPIFKRKPCIRSKGQPKYRVIYRYIMNFEFFETMLPCIDLVVLELSLKTTLASASQRISCLWLLSTYIKGESHHCLVIYIFVLLTQCVPKYWDSLVSSIPQLTFPSAGNTGVFTMSNPCNNFILMSLQKKEREKYPVLNTLWGFTIWKFWKAPIQCTTVAMTLMIVTPERVDEILYPVSKLSGELVNHSEYYHTPKFLIHYQRWSPAFVWVTSFVIPVLPCQRLHFKH